MSGNANDRLISLDSCVFLAWFNKEQDKPLDRIEDTIRLICDQKVDLLVSAVCYAEIMDKAGDSTAGTEFRGFVKRQNVIIGNVDARVGDLASVIRTQGLQAMKDGALSQGIKIPDALIVATAVIYKSVELQTFDPVLKEAGQLRLSSLRTLEILDPGDANKTPLGF